VNIAHSWKIGKVHKSYDKGLFPDIGYCQIIYGIIFIVFDSLLASLPPNARLLL
jgi:hypothetical protein